MHVASIGIGPATILFLHGFPELWYTWRHQLISLSALGYRCIAPDLRGFGDTDAPSSPAKYTAFHIVGDLVGLLDALKIDKVFLVGHDWGAAMAWYFCRLRPDRVTAVVNLSIALNRNPDSVLNVVQEVGKVEEEFAEVETGKLMVKLFTLFSKPDPPMVPRETGFRGLPDPPSLPSWLSEEDVQYYASKFQKSGFTGGLNYYRALPLTGELMGPWAGGDSKYTVPAKFIVGDQDVVYVMVGIKDYIHSEEFKKEVPLLEEVVVMEGVPHFPNLVKPHEITQHILDFIKRF
ncbi:unnamed protein product [Linum tenue]|uniref:soluble epoxide hydrolase n=1 Tax=Linum tenue TaxID=586396 RepID=A0AAV0KN02_9ROSI|nr:unnamed protein product [Linum tenue]